MWGVEQPEFSDTDDGSINLHNHFEKLAVSEHKHHIELNINIPHSSAIPLPGIYPTEMSIQSDQKARTRTFRTGLFLMPKNLGEVQIFMTSKMDKYHVDAMQYWTSTRTNELQVYMDESHSITLIKKSQIQKKKKKKYILCDSMHKAQNHPELIYNTGSQETGYSREEGQWVRRGKKGLLE